MSKVKITGNSSGTGVFTITAPGTNNPRTITLPDSTGTLLNSDGRNIVINGGFDVWQRGTSFTSLSYYQKYADRWMGDAHSSGNNTISRQAGTASEPFYYYLRFQRDSGQTVTGIRRVGTVFESQDTSSICGQEVTLSWYMRKGANWSPASDTVTSYIFTGTGNDQGMASGLGSGWTGFAQQTQSNTVTTSWVRFTHTVTLSATATQVGINFATPASVGTAGAADSWDISGIKLELGGVATPFESKGYGEELRDCQRYYQTKGMGLIGGLESSSATTGTWRTGFTFHPEMRTSPTAGVLSGQITYNRPGLAAHASISNVIPWNSNSTTKGTVMGVGNYNLSGGAGGDLGIISAGGNQFTFDAEL